MTQNLITSAFELVRDVEHGVLLLDTFHRLATREVRGPHLEGQLPRVSFPPCFLIPLFPIPWLPHLCRVCLPLCGGERFFWDERPRKPPSTEHVLLLLRPSCEPMRRRPWTSTCCSTVN